MTFTVTNPVGQGAHGDVYKGDNGLGTPVAIKFIRNSVGGGIDFVKDQAKALVRAKCDNVVTVVTIEEVVDPATDKLAPAIIMEWLEGSTLEDLLQGPRLTSADVKRIGFGVIDGLAAIHAAGVTHADFHNRNVMVTANNVKIIDILYYDTLADLTSRSQESAYRKDRSLLRSMLALILMKASDDIDQVTKFNQTLTPESSIDEIRDSFRVCTYEGTAIDVPKMLEKSLRRMSDRAFVDSEDYADALSEDTHEAVIRPLIEAMIATSSTDSKHMRYLGKLWDRLNAHDRVRIGAALGEAIDREAPDGAYVAHFLMLSAFGATGWESLPRLTAIRLENTLLASMQYGQHDAHHGIYPASVLGTWVRRFYRRFKDQAKILEYCIVSLSAGWSRQNYIAVYFFGILRNLVKSEADQKRVVRAIAEAIQNDAYSVKNRLEILPEDWRDEVARCVAEIKEGHADEHDSARNNPEQL